MTLADMTISQMEEHLKNGGSLQAAGGALRIAYFAAGDRYVLLNETGNGGEYMQPRLATVLDLGEQLAGSLAAWEVVAA